MIEERNKICPTDLRLRRSQRTFKKSNGWKRSEFLVPLLIYYECDCIHPTAFLHCLALRVFMIEAVSISCTGRISNQFANTSQSSITHFAFHLQPPRLLYLVSVIINIDPYFLKHVTVTLFILRLKCFKIPDLDLS